MKNRNNLIGIKPDHMSGSNSQAFVDNFGGHGGRVVTLSPPTSVAGDRSPSWP